MAEVAEEIAEAVEAVEEIVEEVEEEEFVAAGVTEIKLFGKWSFDDIEIRDISLEVSIAKAEGIFLQAKGKCLVCLTL
jgi:small subunit ribosomal protein S5e